MIIFSEDMGKHKEGLAQKKFHSSTTTMSSKAKENNAFYLAGNLRFPAPLLKAVLIYFYFW